MNNRKFHLSAISAAVLSITGLASTNLYAQEAPTGEEEQLVEIVEVTGIRSALAGALAEKRSSSKLVEVILAEDIGKLPDQNLAEVLENVTGIQITRTAGVGTGVQIRGTNDNRTLINGVSTVSSSTARQGISFEDLNPAIIAGVEVTKSPDAKSIEGSVGGIVNLRTIRPLQLTETLGSIRIQGEDSSLTTDGVQPRLSGAFGKNWDTDSGKFGFVISGSYTEQDVSSFRPRVDRDGGLVENVNAEVIRLNSDGEPVVQDVAPVAQDFDFVGVQFLNQELENFEFETKNLSTSFEYAPNDNLKFFFDTLITRQEQRQDSTRVQASGISAFRDTSLPTAFETVDFGSLDGRDLGSIQVATQGTIEPNLSVDDDDPNLRFNSDTNGRVTDTELFRIGGEWQGDNWAISAEISTAQSDSEFPQLNTQLNFINPNAPLDGLDEFGNTTASTSNDNAVPFIYDLTGGDLTFGINFDSPFAPTVEQLLDPNNVVLDQVDISASTLENSDDAFRVDFTYFFDIPVLTSVDFGYRYNKTENEVVSVSDRIGGFSRLVDSPNGSLFEELLVAGPSNFGDADGRELALRNFLIVDPDRAFDDQEGVLAILEDAIRQHGGNQDFANFTPNANASFNIEEETHALYAQANFEAGIVRGSIGARYIETDTDSLGNTTIDGVISPVVTSGTYDFFLPRVNIIVEPHEDVVLRFGAGKDINRPDFSFLNSSVTFGTNENAALNIGNPELAPEEVVSFDISAEWYFAPGAFVSVGYFEKERTNIFVQQIDSAEVFASGFRDTDPSCPGGGVFNPLAQPNVFGPDGAPNGLCVDANTRLNDPEETTQSGVEVAFQYDLSSFEDKLGWASGFGVIANFTVQDFEGGSLTNSSATRGTDIFNAINGVYDIREFETIEAVQGLVDFSETAYNATIFYDKYGLSARVRYTWREAFRTFDTAAGASTNSTLGFPVVTHDRGQLNASVTYDVNENLNIGIEAINLTESDITQSCVNEDALLCFQGLTDRRITFGGTYRF
ncbi:TonB-dependent receptor [Alteromonas sp. 5E99-2]|uniref:TonB-dependent receptor n=1 Tax=Alteromonas sp. 5E99-2 TaxID=2817683 RepID=UPI001A987F6E|nr:TonB-dependent receptor [Alteromonas sp. 5E99-2]MBO1255621.1 TonB-dependent receptor [Alteromonas sp. 5E99-2]